MDIDGVITDIDDITDPSSMDKILFYLEHLQNQDEEFMQLLISKLDDMEINWEQPWYQQNNCLTRPVKLNDNLEEIFRTDKITKEEIDLIDTNWRIFRKEYSIPDTPQCIARWRNTQKCRSPQTPEESVRRFVTAYLARGLQRTLYQVYKHIINHYGSPPKGHYSLEEEKIMEVCFYHNARNAIPILSAVLGREPRGIYKKMNEWLNGKAQRKRVRWTLPLATKFLKSLMHYTGLSLDDLKYQKFDKTVWINLENDMEHSYLYLQKFWYSTLHVQLFVKLDVTIAKLRKKIIKKIKGTSCQVWSDIRWKQIAQQFPDGFTHLFLYRVWASMFQSYKGTQRVPLVELIQYAKRRLHSLPNRRLKTLTLNCAGELENVRYDAKF